MLTRLTRHKISINIFSQLDSNLVLPPGTNYTDKYSRALATVNISWSTTQYFCLYATHRATTRCWISWTSRGTRSLTFRRPCKALTSTMTNVLTSMSGVMIWKRQLFRSIIWHSFKVEFVIKSWRGKYFCNISYNSCGNTADKSLLLKCTYEKFNETWDTTDFMVTYNSVQWSLS